MAHAARAAAPATAPSDRPVRLGILAYRSDDDTRKAWQPTADYLSERTGRRFELVPLGFSVINGAAERGAVDFVATSPANYVELEARFGATRIATVRTLRQGVVLTHFAGVVFTRADRTDLNRLSDLRGKTVMATAENSFGGWWMQWRELRGHGLHPGDEFTVLFAGDHQDNVVYAVRDGKADAGTVRADQLDRMAAEGKIDGSAFKVINDQPQTREFPFPRSTRLYPEWPMARLRHTPEDLARDVAVALLMMPPESEAARASGAAGWTSPLDYTPVHEMMRELRVGPYEEYGRVKLAAAAKQYWLWVMAAVAALLLLGVTTVYLLRMNRRLGSGRPRAPGEPTLTPNRERMEAVFRRVAQAAAAVVILIAVVVLAGWVLKVNAMRTLFAASGLPARMRMNPLTAVCFVFCGTSLWLLAPAEVERRSRSAAHVLASLVLLFGVARLAGVVEAMDLGLDRLLFRGRLGDNRMAVNTAAGLVLSALALLCIDLRLPWGIRRRPSNVLAFLAFAIALLALVGYAYGVAQVRGMGGVIAMALDTALCFLLLCSGVVLARPNHEPLATVLGETMGAVVSRRLLPAALVLPLLAGWLTLQGVRVDAYNADFAMLLFTVTTVAVFVGLIWWNAKSLHRLDAERRDAEKALREAEAVYHSLVETLPQNIFRKDLLGRFTFGNRNFCAVLGRTQQEITGKTDLDFFPEELARRYRQDDQRVAETGHPLDIVEEHIRPDGKKLYVQVMKTAVHGPDGRTVGTQGIFWDVTDRKLAEQELERKNRMLEEAARSERLAHMALQQAHEDLKRTQTHLVQSEKLVGLGQMVAGVAHEINNPLAFVSNNVAVLQRDLKSVVELLHMYQQAEPALAEAKPELANGIRELSDRVDLPYTISNLEELLARSRDGLKRIQQIVRDLRDFARLDEADLHDVDLNRGIDSTLNIVMGHAKKKRVTVEKELDPRLPPVSCYPAKVNQVIMNLIVNAIDASKEGGRVTVRTTSVNGRADDDDDVGPAVRVDVIDEGSGIEPAIRQRIFDPFFTTKPPGHGTGLGLSISYGIIQDHGGTISVDSTVGKGSTFTVMLPVRHVKAGAA